MAWEGLLEPALLRCDDGAHSNPKGCSVQEESIFCVLDDPLEPLWKVLPRHGAAGHDPPFVGVNVV